jgi:transcriptional regulator with XRE-family HTH domain
MHPKYPEVIKLRLKGKSYREIAQAVGVSKNSVSRWCKNLKLPLSAQKILEKKSNYPKELFRKYNQLKHKKVQIENQEIVREFSKEIRRPSKYELKLIGVVLHWAEGNKTQPNRVQFANSDSNMVTLYLRFLREIIKIPDEKMIVSIRIHPNINMSTAIKFWSKATKLPRERFHIVRQISRASQGKRPFNSLPYGTLDVRFSGRPKFYQIKGWIDGLIRQI